MPSVIRQSNSELFQTALRNIKTLPILEQLHVDHDLHTKLKNNLLRQ